MCNSSMITSMCVWALQVHPDTISYYHRGRLVGGILMETITDVRE